MATEQRPPKELTLAQYTNARPDKAVITTAMKVNGLPIFDSERPIVLQPGETIRLQLVRK